MKNRSSLPALEHFSSNPRVIRDQNPIPFLSLLGINNSTSHSFPSAATSRVRPQIQLPPLSKIPGFFPEHNNASMPSPCGSRVGSSRTQCQFDESSIKPLPGAPLTPAEVLQVFNNQLVPLEIGEILQFKEIYYIGELESKPFRASYIYDYDDRKKQYRALPNDHIKYRYQIISHAGGGAFSTVYRCVDHKLGIPVAIKIIRAKLDCLQDAELEAKIQSQLNGKHSVKLIESFNFRGHYCLSLELLYTDMLSIAESRQYSRIPVNQVRHITFQTLLCLRELASKGIVHADIKPENIIANDENLLNTKVADFGTACFTEEQIFTYIQSRYYQAPEILYGIRYGPPIDMWSLGCVVFELIVGEVLYSARDGLELARMLNISLGPAPPEIYQCSKNWDQIQAALNSINEQPNPDYYSEDFDTSDFNMNCAEVPSCEAIDEYEEDVDLCAKMQPLSLMLTLLPRPAAQFVKACLVWDPDQRMTPEEALQTEWMQEEIDALIIKRNKYEKEKENEKERMKKTTAKGQNNLISTFTTQKKYAVKEPKTARLGNRPHWHY